MNALVSIPWQPSYVLTPDTLTMLQLASAHAGHNIPVSDAWRPYAEQKAYHDAYLHYLAGGPYAPIASDPDTGQRNHMRGAAVDIQNHADRAAMLAVGFTPDPDEWWHFNNPRWQSMPIIKTNDGTAAAGSSSIPITPTKPRPKDDDMMIYSSTSERGRCYLVTPYEVSPVDDPTNAKQLSLVLTGSESAPKVNGDQINIFRVETERARRQLAAHLAAGK